VTSRREYDPSRHGNVFQWILEESERQRHWDDHRRKVREVAALKAKAPVLHSLDNRNVVYGGKAYVACSQESTENVFEVTKARKL
jgi:hypothetical protein